MAEAAGMMDNITMRELRGTVSRLEALIRQLDKVQNQQASQIAQLTSMVMNMGQSALSMQFWGNQMYNALENKHGISQALGVAMPLMSSITMGIGRGLTLAHESQMLGEKIKRGEIQFGTDADRMRWAVENGIRMTLFSIFG